MSRLTDVAHFASRHRRLLGVLQIVVLLIFFSALGWGLRGSFHSAAHDLDQSNLVVFVIGCAVVAVRRAGVTDAALVTSSMLLEAGLSAVSGVIIFVLSLAFVDNVKAPLAP